MFHSEETALRCRCVRPWSRACVVLGDGGKTNGLSPLDAPSVSEFLRIFIVDASSVELVLASRHQLVKLLGVSE